MAPRQATTRTRTSGISLGAVVQIVFIILKIAGLVDWSWWAVLIPLWIGLGIVVLIFLGFLIYLVAKHDD